MKFLTVSPAYGRDYKSARAAKEAWDAGKDFRIESLGRDMGRYVNKDDAPRGARVTIRYNRMTRLTVINIPER